MYYVIAVLFDGLTLGSVSPRTLVLVLIGIRAALFVLHQLKTAPAPRTQRPAKTPRTHGTPAWMEATIDLIIQRYGIEPFQTLVTSGWDLSVLEISMYGVYHELEINGLLPLTPLTKNYIEGRVLVCS